MTKPLYADPEALASAARFVQREWGETGYSVLDVQPGDRRGSVMLHVRHYDGSEFYVYSDRYGSSLAHGETLDELASKLSMPA